MDENVATLLVFVVYMEFMSCVNIFIKKKKFCSFICHKDIAL